jgi:hypothetical protein
VVFPEEIAERIRERTLRLIADLQPATELHRILIGEIARTSVQVEKCRELMEEDDLRAFARIETTWDADRRREVSRLAARLPVDCRRVVLDLEETKQGAEYCLEEWNALGASVEANGGVTEEQRQHMCDLLGINPILRDNTRRVPACDDPAGLRALVAREVGRLENLLEHTLNDRDREAQALARLGLRVVPLDTAARRLRSDESRAAKRMAWATDALERLKAGAAPETVIDPETGRPVGAGEAAEAPETPPLSPRERVPEGRVRAAAPPRPESPPPPLETESRPDDPPAPPGDGPLPPLPPELTPEDREMLLIFGESIRRMFPSSGGPPPRAAVG